MRMLALLLFIAPLLAQDPPAKPPVAPAAPAPDAVPAAAAPAAAPTPVPDAEQWLTGSIDIGYRWSTGVGGSYETYRSIVNLGSGPKLLGTEFTIIDPK